MTIRRHLPCLGLTLAATLLAIQPLAAQQQQPAFAATRLINLSPSGGKLGTTTEVTVNGSDLDDVNDLWFSHAAIKAERVAGNPVKFKVTVPADLPAGSYDVRAAGKWGLSNPRVFVVNSLEEVVEQEPNNDSPQAQKVPMHSAVTGVVSANTDVDFYSFEGKKGQRVVVHCASSGVDSRLTPMLELFDAKDRRLAGNRQYDNRDAVLDAVLPADGSYTVRLCEFAYQTANAEYFYRLSISTAPWIDGAFPPVVEIGKANKVTLFGRNLPNAQTKDGVEQTEIEVNVPNDRARRLDFRGVLGGECFGVDGFDYRVRNGAGSSNPALLNFARGAVVLDAGDNDTSEKAQKIPVPCDLAGRIERRGDRDRYSFQAKQGEVYVFEGFADRLGSPFDMYFEVRRADNNQSLGEFDDNAEQPAAFGKFFTRTDDPKGRVAIPADGTYELFVGSRTGDTTGGPRHVYRVAITKEEPDFRLVVANNSDLSGGGWTLRRGGNMELQVVCVRQGGFAGEVVLTAEGLPDGVTCIPQVVAPNQRQSSLVLSASADAADWVGSFKVVGKATLGTAETMREARTGCIVWPTNQPNVPAVSRLCQGLCLAIRDSGPFTINAASQEVTVTPGGTATIKLTVNRRWPDFKGQIQLARLAGPVQANGQPLPLPATQVGPTQTDIEVKFQVPANTPTGSYTVAFLGTSPQVSFQRDAKAPKANVPFNEPSPAIKLNVFTASAEVSIDKPLVVLKPGAEQTLGVKVKRVGGLTGDLTLELVVPKTLEGVTADKVTVGGKDDAATMTIKAGPKAKFGVSPDVLVRATAKVGSQTITADARLKLAVTEDGTYEDVEPKAVPLLAASSDGWRFIQAAKVQGDKWRAVDFDDKPWKAGKAPVGYGEEEIGNRKGTVSQETGNVYFRRTIDIAADVAGKAGVTYKLNVASDNSAVVYVNGEKLDEDPEADHEFKYWNREVDVPAKLLKPGKNVIAVLVKNTDGSSDLFFDLELTALVPGGKKK